MSICVYVCVKNDFFSLSIIILIIIITIDILFTLFFSSFISTPPPNLPAHGSEKNVLDSHKYRLDYKT